MKRTLQFFSIQHELGMSIGLDLRLTPMLRQFTRVCIRRMGLTAVHYYFLHNAQGELVLSKHYNNARLKHYLSIPDSKENNFPVEEFLPNDLDNRIDRQNNYCVQKFGDNNTIYHFRLSNFGYILLQRNDQPVDDELLELIKPIIERLTISCQASIEHEQLLHAIEAKKKAEERIFFRLNHDDLTQLPNRRKLIETLEQDISRCQRHNYHGAVLFIDLDRFKTVNDTLGHSAGDELLKSVAGILTGSVRKEDTVARLSGDEFVILLTELGPDRKKAARNINKVISKIRETFTNPIVAGEHILHITPSIGVEIYPADDLSTDQILRHADTAMYQAKAHGPNLAFYYDQKMSAELETRLDIEKKLQQAVKSLNEFELHYQPQYSDDGELIGAEALIRWQHPQSGLIPPSLFIPVAEETGLMIDIGKWVTRTACRQLRHMETRGLPESFRKLSINVSAIQFNQNDFVDDFLMTIRQSGINAEHLSIELTESTLIKNIDDTIEKMQQLRSNGIHFSIDDFGTGYSSLSYLNRFPIDTLKIDQSFVRNVDSDSGHRAISDTIITLGHSLGLSIIAEGVETQAELECLKGLKCRHYQGYFFSRPIPFDRFCTDVLMHAPVREKRAERS